MFKPLLSSFPVLLCFMTFSLFGQGQDGQLDPSFADGGILLADYAGGNETVAKVAQQSDGKLVAVSSSRYPAPGTFDIQVIRLNEDGTLDETFANSGIFRMQNDLGADLAYDLVLDKDAILVAGSYANEDPNDADFHVFKLTGEGMLDTLFGTRGSAIVKINTNQDYAQAIAVADDGSIYVGGDTKTPLQSADNSVLVKLTASGQVDSTFGTNGIFIWNDGDDVDRSNVRQVLIAPDGNILTSGRTKPNSSDRISVYKILADGSGFVTDFGDGGEVLTPLQGYGYGMALHPNGTIFVTGQNLTTEGTDLVVTALDQTGATKANFGVFGVATINEDLTDTGLAIAVQPDGKIVIGGESGGTFRQGGPRKFLAARMDTLGVLDTTWNGTGIVTTQTSDFFAFANSILVQSDGKIVLGGASATQTTQNDITLVRYTNFIDADGDGFDINTDCNDFAEEINPAAFDIPGNGIDEDCNGEDTAVATREADVSHGFELFPNPAGAEVTLRARELSLRAEHIAIYTVGGRLLRTYAPGDGAAASRLSLEGLPAGVLIVRVQTGRGVAIARIVKR